MASHDASAPLAARHDSSSKLFGRLSRSAGLFALLGYLASPLAAAQDPGTVRDQRLFGPSPQIQLKNGDQFGRAVSVLGDVDGDGVCDLVVGAHADDDGGLQGTTSDVGAVYVLFLTQNGGLKGAQKISATEGGFTAVLNDRDFFGKAVAGIGDFDGDGVPDMAVGSTRDDDGGSARGAVYLILLHQDGTVKQHFKISSTAGGFDGPLKDIDEFGSAVANLGDLDGDGIIDLIVGARLDDTGGYNRGAAYVLFLQQDGSVRTHVKIATGLGGLSGPLRDEDSFGQAATGIGDLDGDGIPDAVVGATKDDDGGFRKGAVYVLFLRSDGTVDREQKISALAGGFVGPLTGNDEFGNGITGLGDLDGDGVTDIAVGAIFDKEAGISRGAVWILFLYPDGSVKREQKINEFQGGFGGDLSDGGEFGESVYTLGDLDGDGVAELGVGERFRDAVTGRGAVWVLHMNGNPTDPALPSFTQSTRYGAFPLTVDFQDRTLGDGRRWKWDFGDGAVSYVRDPSHVYTAPGHYFVTLSVETPCDTFGWTASDSVIVTNTGTLDADFTATPNPALVGADVHFLDQTAGGPLTSWEWSFGDEATSSEANPVHAYSAPGTYTVTLTVSDGFLVDTEIKEAYLVVERAGPPLADIERTKRSQRPIGSSKR